jgi:hypothetical protein
MVLEKPAKDSLLPNVQTAILVEIRDALLETRRQQSNVLLDQKRIDPASLERTVATQKNGS